MTTAKIGAAPKNLPLPANSVPNLSYPSLCESFLIVTVSQFVEPEPTRVAANEYQSAKKRFKFGVDNDDI